MQPLGMSEAKTKRIYICFATRFAETGVLPAIAYKPGFDEVWILRGLSDPDGTPSESDHANAISPARRTVALFEARGLSPVRQVDIAARNSFVTGHALAAQLKQLDSADIVLNVTGGMKPANFGAMAILRHWVEDRGSNYRRSAEAIYMDTDGLGYSTVDRLGETPMWREDFDFTPGMTLEEFLGLRGYRITQSEDAPAEPLLEAADRIWTVLKNANGEDRSNLISSMRAAALRSNKSNRGEVEITPFPTAKIGPLRTQLVEALTEAAPSEFDLIDAKTGAIRIKSVAAQAFLGNGSWFELLIMRKLEQRLAANIDLRLNLELELDDISQNAEPTKFRELDVVAFDGRQLCVVECKTGAARPSQRKLRPKKKGETNHVPFVTEPGVDQAEMNKIASVRMNIAGNGGFACLINPRDPGEQTPHFQNMQLRAQAEGVGLFVSADGVEQGIEEIARRMS